MTAHTSELSTARPSGVSPGYVLFLLMFGYVLSFFDRQILVLMIDPISRDLGLTDTHFGLLYGFAFALFYTVIGVFFGRVVDSFNRMRVLAGAVLLWSLATAACGLASSFTELFIARMLVGVGEAGLAPVAYSLIADLFEPRKRARAFSIYACGIYIGTGVAFLLGGKLIATLDQLPPLALGGFLLQGWHLAFLLAGIPGILLALALLASPEPPRGGQDTNAAAAPRASFSAFIAHWRANWRALSCHHLGFAMHTGFGYAIALWTAAFFTRVHGWSIGDIGLALGALLLTTGPLGAVTGGTLADWLLRRGVSNAYLKLSAFVCLAQAGAVAFMVFTPSPILGLLGAAFAIITMGMTAGPAGAALQAITPSALRGQAGGFYTFVANLLGLSLVPLLVALVTDHVFEDPTKVGLSLAIVGASVLGLGAVLLWMGRNYFRVQPQQ